MIPDRLDERIIFLVSCAAPAGPGCSVVRSGAVGMVQTVCGSSVMMFYRRGSSNRTPGDQDGGKETQLLCKCDVGGDGHTLHFHCSKI